MTWIEWLRLANVVGDIALISTFLLVSRADRRAMAELQARWDRVAWLLTQDSPSEAVATEEEGGRS